MKKKVAALTRKKCFLHLLGFQKCKKDRSKQDQTFKSYICLIISRSQCFDSLLCLQMETFGLGELALYTCTYKCLTR